MLYYIVRRVLTMIPTLFVISLLTFVIIELPAGDYISNQIAALRATGESASIAKLEFLRAEFALDRPFLERYLIWIGLWPGVHGFDGLLQGNWGWSFEYEKPVSEVVGPTLPLTIVLNAATILFVYVVSFRSVSTRRPDSTPGATMGSHSSAISGWQRRTSCSA